MLASTKGTPVRPSAHASNFSLSVDQGSFFPTVKIIKIITTKLDNPSDTHGRRYPSQKKSGSGVG